jgi:hypothetical protein
LKTFTAWLEHDQGKRVRHVNGELAEGIKMADRPMLVYGLTAESDEHWA